MDGQRIPYEEILKQKHPFIRERVNPVEILYDIDLMPFDIEHIECRTKNEGNQRGVDKLIECVKRRGEKCFLSFLRALHKNKYDTVVDEIVRYGGINPILLQTDQTNNGRSHSSLGSNNNAAYFVQYGPSLSQLMLENDITGPSQPTTNQNIENIDIYQRHPPPAQQMVNFGPQLQNVGIIHQRHPPPPQQMVNYDSHLQRTSQSQLQFRTHGHSNSQIAHTADVGTADRNTMTTAKMTDKQAAGMGACPGVMNLPTNSRQFGTDKDRQAYLLTTPINRTDAETLTVQQLPPSLTSIQNHPPQIMPFGTQIQQSQQEQVMPPRALTEHTQPHQEPVMPPRALTEHTQPQQEPVMPPKPSTEYTQPQQGLLPPSPYGHHRMVERDPQNSDTDEFNQEQNARRREIHGDFKLQDVEDRVLKKWEERLSEKGIGVLCKLGSKARFTRGEIRELDKGVVKPEESGQYVLDKLLDKDSNYTVGQFLDLLAQTDIPDVITMVLDDMDKINFPSGQNNLNGSTHNAEPGSETSKEYNIKQDAGTDQLMEKSHPCPKLDSLDTSVNIIEELDTSGDDNTKEHISFVANGNQIQSSKVAVENKEDSFSSDTDSNLNTSLCDKIVKKNEQEHLPIQAQADSENRMAENNIEVVAEDLKKAVYIGKCDNMESISNSRNADGNPNQHDARSGEYSTRSNKSEEERDRKIKIQVKKEENNECPSFNATEQTDTTVAMQSSIPLDNENSLIDENVQMPGNESRDGYRHHDFKVFGLDSLTADDIEPDEEIDNRLHKPPATEIGDNQYGTTGTGEQRFTSPIKAESDPDCKASEKPLEQECQRLNMEINNQPNIDSFRDIQNSIPDHHIRHPQTVTSVRNPDVDAAQPAEVQRSLPDEDIIDSQLDIEQNMAQLQDQTFLKDKNLQ